MKINCIYSKLISLDKIKPHPRNRNTHSDEQIKLLEKAIKRNGIRKPLIVSKKTDHLITGHATLQALKNLGVEKAPVDYQDFKSQKDEYRHLVADNETQRHSWLNMNDVFNDLDQLDFDPDIDLEELGIISKDKKGLTWDSIEEKSKKIDEEASEPKTITCPHCQKSIMI